MSNSAETRYTAESLQTISFAPAKTNTQADPTSTALKGEYFGNANLSTLVKTQTNPSAGAESIRNAFGGGGFSADRGCIRIPARSQCLLDLFH